MQISDDRIARWLREDLGHHDVTTDVPGETTGRLVATEPGVVAGLNAAARVFEYLDVTVEEQAAEGARIDAGDVVLRVEGNARSVLRGERLAVNLAGHASGIATKTREAVDRAREVSDAVAIAGTRKTTPGLRGLEKRAVVAGGGDTHRLDQSHAVMVKDNHIEELGMKAAIERFAEKASFVTPIEVEAESIEQARRAADAGADIVLLDNMSTETITEAVAVLPDDVVVEASGGITIEDVPKYARAGVDVISMGALTHSAPALDYSFRTG